MTSAHLKTSTEVLSVRGLAVDYQTRAGTTTALRGVDLHVHRGEVVALVGESGSGKSTLGRAVIGLLAANAAPAQGAVDFEGTALLGLSERKLSRIRGRRIGFVPQDPSVSLDPLKRVGEQVAETLRVHGVADRRQARDQAVQVLERAGVDRPGLRAGQYPHELSGGMCQRVLIGMALACEPTLVIADEPTSALDVTVQRVILDYLTEAVAQHEASLLLVTHDLAVAAERADRIVVMQGGLVVETGTSRQILTDPREPYTRRLLEAAPSLGRARARTRSVASGTAARGLVPAEPAVVLGTVGLSKTFGAGDHAVHAVTDVAIGVRRGQTRAVVGGSGSGKTTLGRLILRLVEPTSGAILVDGDDISGVEGAELRRLRRRIQLVYQNPFSSLSPFLDVERMIEEPLRAFGIGSRRERAQRVAEALSRVALPQQVLRRRAAELSGGQQQRVAIARALIVDPEVIVLDEPTSALDVSVQEQVLQLLTSLQDDSGLSYLFISHDLAVVRQVAHDVSVMHLGRIVEEGPTDQIFDSPAHPYTRELLDSLPRWEP